MSKMKFKFSRHAKRRMKLYNISQEEVKLVLEKGKQTKLDEKTEYLYKISKVKYPIKVITENMNNYTYIITAYPLKRGYK